MSVDVLDASAVLAYLNDEPGSEAVAAVANGALLHPINLAEVLTVIGRTDPGALDEVIYTLQAVGVGFVGSTFGVEEATLAAQLWAQNSALSLGDRCCLAYAMSAWDVRVHTADRAWSDLDLAVDVRQIR